MLMLLMLAGCADPSDPSDPMLGPAYSAAAAP